MFKVRPHRSGKGLEYDIHGRRPDGTAFRERAKSPVSGRQATERWVTEREALLLRGEQKEVTEKECPTFEDFLPRWWAARKANLKESTRELYDYNMKADLTPFFGKMLLTEIKSEAINKFSQSKAALSPKTVANLLRQLRSILLLALEYEELTRVPTIRITLPKRKTNFYRPEEFEKLVTATHSDPVACAIVLLGGEAGLRSGEMLALTKHRECIDHKHGLLTIRYSIWRGHESTTKTGEERIVPATPRVLSALKALKGQPFKSYKQLQYHLRMAQKEAGFIDHGKVHSLRHTFATRLLSSGVGKAHAQNLIGHATPQMTDHYSHVISEEAHDALRSAFGGALTDRSVVSGVSH